MLLNISTQCISNTPKYSPRNRLYKVNNFIILQKVNLTNFKHFHTFNTKEDVMLIELNVTFF